MIIAFATTKETEFLVPHQDFITFQPISYQYENCTLLEGLIFPLQKESEPLNTKTYTIFSRVKRVYLNMKNL